MRSRFQHYKQQRTISSLFLQGVVVAFFLSFEANIWLKCLSMSVFSDTQCSAVTAVVVVFVCRVSKDKELEVMGSL